MRPEWLELEGFTAFRRHTEVDFSDADLCAFWGPTGAGKSSVIDAIIFALYGSVPRYDDRRRVAPAISQGSTEARVRLDFALGPDHYRAVRVVRATATGATTKEARLERLQPGGQPEVLAGDAEELTSAVEQLLGLSYEHFTTCVVLPQGSFARFLHHKPRDRQALLVELLDLGVYEQMAALARERAVRAKDARTFAQVRLDELADATPQRCDGLRGRQRALDAALAEIDAARRELELLAEAEATATERAQTAATAAAALGAVVVPADAVTLADAAIDATVVLAEAQAALSSAELALEVAEAAAAAQPSAAEVRLAAARHVEAAEQRRLVAKGEAALEAAVTAAASANAAATAAAEALTAARAALDVARTADLAATLAEGLKPGDPCPVCRQPVGELHVAAGPALADARRREARAVAADRAASQASRAAEVEHSRVEERLARERAHLDQLDTALAGGLSAADAAVALAAIAAAEAELDAARTGRRAASDACAAAQRRVADTAADLARAWAVFDRARDAAAGAGAGLPPPPGRTDLAADWRSLAYWAAEQAPGLLAAAAEAAEAVQRGQAEATAVAARVVAAAASVGLDAVAPGRPGAARPGPGPGRRGSGAAAGGGAAARPELTALAVRDLVVREQAANAAALARAEEDLAKAETLRAELTAAAEVEAVTATLARHLQANGFQKWVLEAAMERLVAGATELLHRLSGGAYSLTLEPKTSNFAVIDHLNADAVRSARTLSGGETFLTSLALALALADQVVELAGAAAAPLESIFLDEGFGTLDPDTLDTVATAIEELGSSGRMVALVSHVRDLAERLPVRFEVQKGPAGATITKVVA